MPNRCLKRFLSVTRVEPSCGLTVGKVRLDFREPFRNWLAISSDTLPAIHFALTERPLFGFVTLFFGYSGEMHRDGRKADAPSPSQAHVQSVNSWSYFGSTGLCESNRTWNQFGNRHLNRADGSENRPAQCPRNKHSGATLRACWSIRHCQRQSESRCSDHADVIKAYRGTLRCCFVSVSFPSDGRLRP